MLTTKRAELGSIIVELTLTLVLSLLPSGLLIVYSEEQSLPLIYLHWRKTRSPCHTPPFWLNFQNLFVMSRQQMGGLNFCFHTMSLGTKQHSPSRLMEISHWKQWTSSFPSAAHPTLCENTEECGGLLQGRPSFKQFVLLLLHSATTSHVSKTCKFNVCIFCFRFGAGWDFIFFGSQLKCSSYSSLNRFNCHIDRDS